MNPFIDIKFEKPLYPYNGKYCIRLRDKYLKQAKKTGKPIRLITPHGTGIYTYQKWMKGSKRFEQVYNFPDRPMVLYQNYFEPGHGEPNMKEYKKNMKRLVAEYRRILKNVEKKEMQVLQK